MKAKGKLIRPAINQYVCIHSGGWPCWAICRFPQEPEPW